MSNRIKYFVYLFILFVKQTNSVSLVNGEKESGTQNVNVAKQHAAVNSLLQAKQIPILPANPINSATETAASYSPCTCKDDVCSCCSKVFGTKNCMKFRFIPDEFLFEFRLMLNGTQLMKRKYQGKNPEPSCYSLLGISAIKLCADFSNVHFRGRNMHLCLDTYMKYNKTKYLHRKFDCMLMGEDGVRVISKLTRKLSFFLGFNIRFFRKTDFAKYRRGDFRWTHNRGIRGNS